MDSTNTLDSAASSGFFAAMGILFFVVLAFLLFFLICHWRIFTKAGQAGWKSIIPLYNGIIQLRITRQPAYWLLLFFIPLVNIYFGVRHINGLSRAFGKDIGFTIGLLFLPIIFYPILAFGDAEYQYNNDNKLLDELQEVR
jgi:hypothetical protein